MSFPLARGFSDRKSLLLTRPLPAAVAARAERLFAVTQRPQNTPLTEGERRAALFGFDAILCTLGDRFGAADFAAVPIPRTQILANFGVGYNHIDVAAAGRIGIAVTNTPGVVTEATADLALTLILMTARRAGEGERLLRRGAWEGWAPTQLLGLPVSGQSLGIIGMGRIGQALARRAHFGLGMSITYHSRSPITGLDFPAMPAPLLQVMGADFVALAVPGGAATRHLIGAAALAAMKKTGILINVARGDVVDEAALAQALTSGQIAGAGLDVYEREPEVSAALLTMENVTLLPHLGTAVGPVREAMGMMALDNLEAFFAGQTPRHLLGA